MPRRIIDLAKIDSIEALFARITTAITPRQEPSPNLDALYDVLGELKGDWQFTFLNGCVFWKRFPDFFPRFVTLMISAESSNEAISVRFRP